MNKEIDFKKARTAHLRLGAVSCWAFYSVAGLGWFRLFGVGLHWKDTSRHRMYFSERNGYKKALKIASCGVVASVIFHHPWVKYGGILALTKRSK